MSLKNIYKNRLGSSMYLTRSGKALHFIDGKHITDDDGDIMELENELKRGHPHIYVDPAEAQIDTTLQDKIAEAQKEAALKVLSEYNQGQQQQSQMPQMPNAEQTKAPATVSAAQLLNVSTTANLSTLSAPSGT